MVSEVSICNQALGWLGQNRITSLDDESVRAQLCKENYPFLRDAVLEERMWTFATVRAKNVSNDRDEWDAKYVHPKPQGWMKVFRVFKNVTPTKHPDTTWCFEDGNVLSDYNTVYMWGIQQVTNTGKYSMLFAQCLAQRIAADLCIALTENRKLQVDMWALYGDKIAEAAARDGQQGLNEQINSDKYIHARARGYVLR
jgi:hypothetical protein